MALKLEVPVQTPMAIALRSSPCNGDYNGRSEGKLSCRRRVFVQTENGCVLGMELDRKDNAHTVKRRLQLSLNVPTDGSSLTFGDVILNNDLTAIRNDSQLLLTKNLMHRSSSTPCLSPTWKALQQRDQSALIEVLGRSNYFAKTSGVIKEMVKAIKIGVEPIPANGGLGGAYYFRNRIGQSVAIVKPTDEEPFAPNNPKGFVGKSLGQPGLKQSVRVGETGFREVAAYLLDYDHFASVPPTALVKITHSIFNVNDCVNGNRFQNKETVSKIASLQQFIPHDFDASDYGTSSFPVAAVHRIGILDVRIFNTDRHAGNILVRKLDNVGKFGQVELIPIDHGLCLPECLEDPYLEWIHWPQASIPFSEDELEYIQNLDPIRDSEMLLKELPMIREACLRVLVLSTVFLKEAANCGLCLAEIGEMMSREFRCQEEEPSELESVCLEARRMISEREIFSSESELSDGEGPFEMEIEDGRPLSKQDESFQTVKVSKLALSLKRFGLGKKSQSQSHSHSQRNRSRNVIVADVPSKLRRSATEMPQATTSFVKLGDMREESQRNRSRKVKVADVPSKLRRSATEMPQATTSFVKLGDMREEEWCLFLEKFKELIRPAFISRKLSSIAQRKGLRLGASCQF